MWGRHRWSRRRPRGPNAACGRPPRKRPAAGDHVVGGERPSRYPGRRRSTRPAAQPMAGVAVARRRPASSSCSARGSRTTYCLGVRRAGDDHDPDGSQGEEPRRWPAAASARCRRIEEELGRRAGRAARAGAGTPAGTTAQKPGTPGHRHPPRAKLSSNRQTPSACRGRARPTRRGRRTGSRPASERGPARRRGGGDRDVAGGRGIEGAATGPSAPPAPALAVGDAARDLADEDGETGWNVPVPESTMSNGWRPRHRAAGARGTCR